MREPILMAACGKKGVGKTWQHMIAMNGYILDDRENSRPGRKCLIMDINDEYGEFRVPAISLNDVPRYTIQTKPEIRRIRPIIPHGMKRAGQRMTLDEWASALWQVLQIFRNGLLLIEDLNKFIGDHIPQDFVGAICTNRHAGLDILMSYQSIGRINTKIWGNLNILRFHKNIERVERHQNKFPDKFEMMRIAEILVDKEYAKGNNRFFVYVNMDEEKISFQSDVDEALISESINQFLSENPRIQKQLTAGIQTKDHKKAAFQLLRETYF